jgi:hypothetical protein
VAASCSLGGCAGVGDSFASVAFVDPAKYDLYDCKRLETERPALVAQAEAKQALIDKAKTGTGGAFIGEAVYRNDYIALRAQKKLADEVWVRNGCDAVTLPPEKPATPAPKPR